MDILKLLSRSSKKLQRPSSAKGESNTKLPSAGSSANPQLFHDAVPEIRGKKRKRTSENIEDQAKEQEEDVDFFAPKSTKPKSKSDNASDVGKPRPSEGNLPAPKLLDDDECRQILRSHRLKLTLLPSSKVHKKGKKSKKAKIDKVPVKVKGIDFHAQPLEAFDDLRTTYGISRRLGENLLQQGYKVPTEVQMGSLPLLLRPKIALGSSMTELNGLDAEAGVNLLAVAPTGSGKTLAFLIPVVDSIVQRRRVSGDKHHELEAIIVAPTKELASQIVNEAKKLCIGTGIKVVGMRKGMGIVPEASSAADEDSPSEEEEEESELEDTAPRTKSSPTIVQTDILVTTPGLVLSALSSTSAETPASLPSIRTLVLDEADVLLDPLFRDQSLGIWNSCTNTELCVTLWSATIGSNIEELASSTIHTRGARVGLDVSPRLVRLIVGLKDSAIPNITHKLIYAATEPGKLIALRQLLYPTARSTDGTQPLRPPFLVFTQTIPRAIALHSELLYDIPASAGGSTRIAVLHSELSDPVRDQVMTRFRNGEIWVLITTDILSRGVDFRGINGVVNYDVPNSGAAYIHRVGRTGRAGRDGGMAITFYTKEDIPYVKNVANIIAASEKAAGKPESEASMQKWLLDALPKPSKNEKKKLKMYGVEARRGGLGKGKEGKEAKGKKGRMQISTKSGYERKLENNRKGAIQGSKRRLQDAVSGEEDRAADDGEWGGIDE